jgi:hypothetical protein
MPSHFAIQQVATSVLSPVASQLIDEFLQRSKLPFVNQVKLLHKENEVFEGGV